jgi:hypothetical protein
MKNKKKCFIAMMPLLVKRRPNYNYNLFLQKQKIALKPYNPPLGVYDGRIGSVDQVHGAQKEIEHT